MGTAKLPVRLLNDKPAAGEPGLWTVTVTRNLADLLSYAHHWSKAELPKDGCTLTFSSMLAALVAGPDDLCGWLRGHLALRGVSDAIVTKSRPFMERDLPTEPLSTTRSFREALVEATALAGTRALDVRDFMAAYVVVRDYHREDFIRLRIDRRAWCLDLAALLVEQHPDEASRWNEFAKRAPAVLVPGFDADLPSGSDLLGVGREVEAFAMLIAGKDTLTPLSVGIFGAWGSGKSYFMKRVEERVVALAQEEDARDYYYRHVAQVRFNAWHYSESNVVASLVDHIFKNLRFGPKESEAELAARRQDALAEMQLAKDLVRAREAELDTARAEEAAKAKTFAEVEAEVTPAIAKRREEIEVAQATLDELTRKLAAVTEGERERLAKAADQAPLLEAASQLEQKLLEDPKIKKLSDDVANAATQARWVGLNTTTILLGVGVFGAMYFVTQAIPVIRDSAAVSGLVMLLSSVTPVAATALKRLREFAELGAKYKEAVAKRTRAAAEQIAAQAQKERDKLDSESKQHQAEVTKVRAEIAALEQQMQTAEESLLATEGQRTRAEKDLEAASAIVLDKQKELEAITAGSLLEDIVGELSASDEFAKQLGPLARARTDFERLSERIAFARTEFAAGRTIQQPVLDRIVLYIDDLDRCPADKVREVLRAVHLLLAFDLFVCVVAVDPRWVIQCLAESPGIVKGGGPADAELEELGGAATPSDYLEKIFQIPLWLRPVPSSQRAALVGALLKQSVQLPPTETKELAKAYESPLHPEVARRGLPAKATGDARAPEKIEVDKLELAFLPRIAPLLDGNPRALKRFANTYRLVKSALSDVELGYFLNAKKERKTAPYQFSMAQLAVLATQRKRARFLVSFADGATGKLTVDDWLTNMQGASDASAKGLARDLTTVLDEDMRKLDFADFAIWLERTRRYSFYL